ncbi:MAG TPA: response regulator [Ignavibacteriaceae bacterium]|nr:response regulator [Ignavibacteriaceae bacterium]
MKILIVEDDPGILLGLQELLKTEFSDILVSSSGREGYAKALSENPDIVLLDVNLPELNGFEICRKLRAKNFCNPVIMLTSRSERIDKVIGLEIGADDYILKPFDTRELLARIHSQLRRKERINEDEKKISFGKKLLCILFSDIKDYSKKMNLNEQAAIEALKEHNIIMRNAIKEFNGEVVEIIGDAFLAAFKSAAEAAECAVQIQKRFEAYNLNKASDEKIEIRISVHLGDVVQFEGGLKGDVINVAARIQEVASAGAIYISENVYKILRSKTNIQFEQLGEYQFKNIKEPVALYRIIY